MKTGDFKKLLTRNTKMKILRFFLMTITAVILISVSLTAQTHQFYTQTYPTVTLDTVAVAGSTNAGSDWFTNPTDKPFSEVWLEVYNGTKWTTYKVAYDCKDVSKLKMYHYGADSTIAVQGYIGGKTIEMPLWTGPNTYGYTLDLGVTAAWYARFKGIR